MTGRLISGLTVLMGVLAQAWGAGDWAQFRGPGGAGVSDLKGLPETWSAEAGIAWKSDLPGPGSSSPVVSGDRIFLTCYGGYGLDKQDPGAQDTLAFHVLCVGAADGKIQWDKTLKAQTPVDDYARFTAMHGYASSTPAVDADAVYTAFGRTGVQAWKHDGTPLWEKSVGDGTFWWGTGASPVLEGDLLLVNAFVESKALIALNRKTGEEVWRQGNVDMAWDTPLVVTAAGRREAVLSCKGGLRAFDARKGTPLWTCRAIDDYVVPSMVADGDVVYSIGGRQNAAVAVRAGGSGDVTASRVLWRIDKGSNVASPVLLDGRLYWAHDTKGVVYCVDAKDGKLVYEEKLAPPPRQVYASPLAADGRLYFMSRENGCYVLAAGPQFKLLAHNAIASDGSVFNASPVPLAPHRLLLRSDKALYCVGGK